MSDRRRSRSRSVRRNRYRSRERDRSSDRDVDNKRTSGAYDTTDRMRDSDRDRRRDTHRYRDRDRSRERSDDRDRKRIDRDGTRRDRDSDGRNRNSSRRDRDSGYTRNSQRDRSSEDYRRKNVDRDGHSTSGSSKNSDRDKQTARERSDRRDKNDTNRIIHTDNKVTESREKIAREDKGRDSTTDGGREVKSKVERTRERDRLEEEQARKMQYGKPVQNDLEEGENGESAPIDKEKPNFELSGMLAKETNTVDGVELKYAEPVEARKPKLHWRLYPYKGTTELPILHIHRQSAYLFGRDRKVVDIPIDHPSCSNQHAVIQYRLVTTNADDGSVKRNIKPYLIDLDSGNGTFINKAKIKARRYHELKVGDSVTFALSSREYVIMYAEMNTDEA